jgi:hypothetical protein
MEKMLKTPKQELAYQVATRDGEWGMTGCLVQAKAAVALRGFDVLDDFSTMHIRVLALLCSGEGVAARSAELHLMIGENELADYLVALRDEGYAAQDQKGDWMSTSKGEDVTTQIGIEMLGMDAFRMQGHLEASERLLNKLRA